METTRPPSVADTMTMTPEAVPGGDAPPPPPAGLERYVLHAEIGRGGMGRVVEARDAQFGRMVAIKELHAGRDDVAARERFVTEALVTGNLEHPSIAPVYERGARADGSPYYVMRRIRGRTLAQAIADADGMPARLRLAPVVVRAAQAVGYAHERGVVHRDIKPENVLVGEHGETTLLDWGLAKVRGVVAHVPAREPDLASLPTATGSHTVHGSVMGTLAYMAPEQAAGRVEAIDERSDVFALGAVLYHVLVGRPPYEGATTAEVLRRAAACEFAPPEKVARGVPPVLASICRRAMAKAPGERYATAAELARALEGAEAEALAGRAGRAVGWFVNAVQIIAVALVALATFFVWTIVPTMREQGAAAPIFTGFAAAGMVLSAIEWKTRGRYALSPLALALALMTLFIATASMFGGIGRMMSGLSKPTMAGNAELYREILAAGTYEASGNLSWGGQLAAAQIVLWGVARRRVELARRQARAAQTGPAR